MGLSPYWYLCICCLCLGLLAAAIAVPLALILREYFLAFVLSFLANGSERS